MGQLAELTILAENLYEAIQYGGDFDSINSEEMRNMLEYSAKIVVILEQDNITAERVLGKNAREYIMRLKTIAVTLHKAKPMKEKLEDILGNLDWWDTQTIVEDLQDNLFVKED